MTRSIRTFSDQAVCASCAVEIEQPYGYCSNCDALYCLPCSATHFCTPSCQANGCHMGLCVRMVREGIVGPWKNPQMEMRIQTK
jgi:hypothetical protein